VLELVVVDGEAGEVRDRCHVGGIKCHSRSRWIRVSGRSPMIAVTHSSGGDASE
jgi:hypothetical protein